MRAAAILRFIRPAVLVCLAASCAASDPRPRLLCLGDSITRGTTDPDGFGYRDHLQDRLGGRWRFVGPFHDPPVSTRYDTAHAGKESDRSDQALARLPSALAVYLPKPNPPGSGLLVHLGTCDLSQGRAPEEVLGRLEALRAMVHAHDPGLVVRVATLAPVTDPALYRQVQAFNTLLRASTLRWVEVGGAFLAAPDWRRLLSDSVHPNDDGYRVMAEAWASALLGGP